MATMMEQMFRAAKLEPAFFEEVVDNPGLQRRSRWVVALFAMTASVGMFLRTSGTAVNIGLVTTLIAWYVWAFSTYYVGTYFFADSDTPRNRQAIMRVMGFAAAPGILRILGMIPFTGGIVFLVTSVWMVAASALGVQRALGYASIRKAVAISMGCWLMSTLLQGVLMVAAFNAFGVKGG